MPYPVSASPLVSRHHLTSLREEHHPRAYSFSGHNNSMPVRGAPSRALSLSSGRGGGRHSDLHNMAAYREHSFQRHDSAPRLPSHDLSEISPAVTRHDEAAGMHESWPRASMRHRDERTDFGNDSWPARSRRSPSQAMFEPPHHAYQAPPPPLSHTQFHPIAPEGVTAMKPIYSDTDEIMLEVENVQSEHFHDQHQHTHWTVDAMECESSHSRRGSMVGDTAYAPPSMDTGFPCREQCEIRSSPKHLRNDSTVTATVIVAQLSSALSDSLPEDDNPFEPIPLNSTPPK